MSKKEKISSDPKSTLRVINMGLQSFFESLIWQQAKAVQIDWKPPAPRDAEIDKLLDLLL